MTADALNAEWAAIQEECARYLLEPDDFSYRSEALDLLTAADFATGSPHAAIYAAAVALETNSPGMWDAAHVVVEMANAGRTTAQADVNSILGSLLPPATRAGARKMIESMMSVRARRAYADVITNAALSSQFDGVSDADAQINRLITDLQAIGSGATRWETFDDPNKIPTSRRDDWVLEHLVVPGEAGIVSAPPGIGKSTLLRQLAMCAANGLHPWDEQENTSYGDQQVLHIELESQQHNVKETFVNFGIRYKNATLSHARWPAIMTVRKRLNIRVGTPDEASLRQLIRRIRPRLVTIGPLKNMYEEGVGGESYQNSALAVQDALMRMMSDFDFALIIEAHGSRGDTGAIAGSQRWQDWPDVSFSLESVTEDDWKANNGKGSRTKQIAYDAWHKHVYRPNGTPGKERVLMVTGRREANRNSAARIPAALLARPGSGLILPFTGLFA